MIRRVTQTAALLALVLLAAPGLASPIADRAKAYAAKHDLPIREVPIPGGGTRIFVPVTDASHADFMKEFTEAGAVIRQGQDIEHVQLALSPDEALHYGTQVNGVWSAPAGKQAPMAPAQGGRYVAMGLEPEAKDHLAKNIGNPPNGARKGGCMWWLVHAKVGPEIPLAHAMGIKQSAAPSNLVKKLVHAGNENVVVGIAMTTLPQQAQNLRNQIVNFDNAIANANAQIANFELQGGNRIKQFTAQSEPYQKAIAQLQGTIEQRKDQPAIVAGLQAKLDQYRAGLDGLTKAHEAPYVQRIAQLDQQIAAGKANIAQQEQAQAANVTAAKNLVVQRQAEKAKIEQEGPKPAQVGGNPQYAAQLAAYDQQIAAAQNAINTNGRNPRFARNVPAWQQQIANAQQQKAALQAIRPEDYNPAYQQKIAQLDQQHVQLQNQINQFQNVPQQQPNVVQWRQQLAANEASKDKLQKVGPRNYDPQYGQRLNQADAAIAQALAQLAAIQPQAVVAKKQVENLEALKAEIVRGGALNYNPAYEQRIAQIDQQATNLEAQIGAYQYAAPQYANHRAQWAAQLEQVRKSKADLLAKGPAEFSPFDAQIAQFRAQIQQYETQKAAAELELKATLPAGQGNEAVKQQFAAITDQNLLGAPPGGEAKLK